MSESSPLTHLDPRGGVRMVNVAEKVVTAREAVARGKVRMSPKTLALIAEGKVPKGDVLAVSQVAGIMAAKRTPDLIPLCHPLELGGVSVQLRVEPEEAAVLVEARVSVTAQTGAEMEALTAVSTTCLTIYDMCKAVDKGMVISDVRLVLKTGGKSGTFTREDEKIE